MKTTFTSDRATLSASLAAPAVEAPLRRGLGPSFFVAASIVAHAALFLVMGLQYEVPSVRATHEGTIEFSVPALPPLPAEPPAATLAPELLASQPPAPRRRAARVAAPLAAASSEPSPAAQLPAEPSSESATAVAGTLPSDGGGALAMATGTGGGGPLGGGGRGDGAAAARGAGSPGPSGAGVDRRALALSWKAAIERIVHERARRNYPRSALRARLGGTVLLSITVDPQGHITIVRVDRTSGLAALDEAAIASVHDLADLPAPPPELAWQTRALRMPIVYAVR